MRILYVGNHHQANSNDDEGAIYFALTVLGHDVTLLNEKEGRQAKSLGKFDLLLFHKWSDTAAIQQVSAARKVFWYFDLVDYPQDPSIAKRCNDRIRWMQQTTPLVDLGFCTDGDWVVRDTTKKLFLLRQGADERVMLAPSEYDERMRKWGDIDIKVLMTATRNGGDLRKGFVDWALGSNSGFSNSIMHLERGTYRYRLREMIARSGFVLAPDHPCTDRYWSNRLYMAAGFGGVILHPASTGVSEDYDSSEVIQYRSREHLTDFIAKSLHCLRLFKEGYGRRAYNRTLRDHLYRYRVESMLKTIKEKLP